MTIPEATSKRKRGLSAADMEQVRPTCFYLLCCNLMIFALICGGQTQAANLESFLFGGGQAAADGFGKEQEELAAGSLEVLSQLVRLSKADTPCSLVVSTARLTQVIRSS